MFVSTAILYNHDSPRRRGNYLLHDICDGALAVADGKQDKLLVGCLDMLVDIGFAGEYMAAAHKLLQLPEPDDVVIGCGVAPSIRHMAECALRAVGVDPHDRLGINPAFNRPGKQPQLRGDIRKAQQLLGFAPKIGVAELIPMVLETKSCA
jgi:GDPmannose 4,6-dehydratase